MNRGSAWRARALAAAILAALPGCRGDASAELPFSVQGLALDTLFEIGAAEGEAWEAFGGIWDVEVAPDGYLAILDLEAPAVHVYGDDGGHVGSVTATGLDAGTLDRPSGIAWSGEGELLVWDPGSSWISRFEVRDTGVEFVDGWRAFAFGETGFCSARGRTYLSYWQEGQVVHEVGPEGLVGSFAPSPSIPGVETLDTGLEEIAIEELTPSDLFCARDGVLDVSFFGSQIRFHSWEGSLIWRRDFEDFNPLVVYTPDGMGLGRRFDQTEGSHLLRSVVPWGEEVALVQHELRTQEFPEEGEVEMLESRLVRLEDGVELDRTRELPLILAARGARLYSVPSGPFPRVIALEVPLGG